MGAGLSSGQAATVRRQDLWCPVVPTEILPGLYVGPKSFKGSLSWFRDNLVSHGVCVCHSKSLQLANLIPVENYKHINIADDSRAQVDFAENFEETVRFIHSARVNPDNAVYVHCLKGISRSSTIIIVYLMAACNMSSEDAFKYAMFQRDWIFPNEGFLQQIRIFDYQRRESAHSELQALEGAKNLLLYDLAHVQKHNMPQHLKSWRLRQQTRGLRMTRSMPSHSLKAKQCRQQRTPPVQSQVAIQLSSSSSIEASIKQSSLINITWPTTRSLFRCLNCFEPNSLIREVR